MTEQLNGKPSMNFWIIGGAALVWNLIGLMFYWMEVTVTPDALATLTQAQAEFLTGKPGWATSAFAIAVTAGTLGSLFLLLRKSLAVPLFVLSLVGIVVQNVHAFGMANALGIWGTSGLIVPGAVLIIGIALVLYSRAAKARCWLD